WTPRRLACQVSWQVTCECRVAGGRRPWESEGWRRYEMALQYDVAVIGAGTGGEQSALRLRRAGRSVVLIERELIGGGCAYWACIPSKVLLHLAHVANTARRTAGMQAPRVSWSGVAHYRDEAVQQLDDAQQVRDLERLGVTFLRGQAR